MSNSAATSLAFPNPPPAETSSLVLRPALKPLAHLNAERIRILNWNIQKQINPRWKDDLQLFRKNIDLALLQEVQFGDAFLSCFTNWHHSFAQGYSSRGRQTGVMTLAAVSHLSFSHHVTREPLLRTPKAANVTTYALDGCDLQLLVINLHAVNFCLGMQAYQQQLRALQPVLGAHNGPVIFAGDFNTWHPVRIRVLRQFAASFGLSEIHFEEDHRTRVFGHCLDYIFVRQLRVDDAQIRRVDSSDHNPMLAAFSL